jgi:hypothetical protein
MGWLDENEHVEADDGYVGEAPKYIKCPMSFTNDERKSAIQSRVRSRHETINKRLKQWGCLRQQFRRHDIAKHSFCFLGYYRLLLLSMLEFFQIITPIKSTTRGQPQKRWSWIHP